MNSIKKINNICLPPDQLSNYSAGILLILKGMHLIPGAPSQSSAPNNLKTTNFHKWCLELTPERIGKDKVQPVSDVLLQVMENLIKQVVERTLVFFECDSTINL